MLDHLVTTSFITTPQGAICQLIETSDRVHLRVARWKRTGRTPHGTVCIFQGRSEFIEKYFEVIADLRRRGFEVVAFDWRGQGGSERLLDNPRKGHIDDFDLFFRDMDALMQHIMVPYCPKPWFALAHSMGAATMLLALDRGETRFERVVLCSPMVALAGIPSLTGAKLLAYGLNIIGFGGAFIPGGSEACLSTKPFEGNRLSSDRSRYERNAAIVRQATELGLGDPTLGWVGAAFRAMDRFADPDFGSALSTPTLMLYGTEDRLCLPQATAALATRIRLSKAIAIKGARHELLMETDALRSAFYAAFDAFMPGETALPPTPAAKRQSVAV